MEVECCRAIGHGVQPPALLCKPQSPNDSAQKCSRSKTEPLSARLPASLQTEDLTPLEDDCKLLGSMLDDCLKVEVGESLFKKVRITHGFLRSGEESRHHQQ